MEENYRGVDFSILEDENSAILLQNRELIDARIIDEDSDQFAILDSDSQAWMHDA